MLCGFATGAGAGALPLPFGNLPTITTTNQLTNSAASASPSYPVTNGSVTLSFRGAFTPASLNTRLAIQSDDGSDVFVNGVKVLPRKDTATSWQIFDPNAAGSALSIIDYTFTNTEEYCIEIDYQNGAYTPGDTDGVTFYAWNGGGQFRNGIPRMGRELRFHRLLGPPLHLWHDHELVGQPNRHRVTLRQRSLDHGHRRLQWLGHGYGHRLRWQDGLAPGAGAQIGRESEALPSYLRRGSGHAGPHKQ